MFFPIHRPFALASIAVAFGTIFISARLSATPVSYTISNGFQDAWSGVLDVSSLASPIGTIPSASPAVTAITAVSDPISWSFAPTSYSLSPTSDFSSPVVEWVGNSGNAFFRLYSTTFYNFVSGGGTWNSALGQTFAIETAAWYAEDSEVASLYTDGGSITFAVPEPSTYAMALAGAACGGCSIWRRRKRT